jgi:lipopolysaccharide heptosyltransferase II
VIRILLLRLREIGDVVFTTPAIRALRRRFPDAFISYVVEPHAAPVVRHNPHLDDVIVAPRGRGPRGRLADLALVRRLRAGRYDVAIDFHGGPRAAWLTWLSGAQRRIGYAAPGRSWMYTDRIRRPRELRARHSVRNQWDLLAPLNIPDPDPAEDPVEMRTDAASSAAVATRLDAAGVAPDSDVVVLHVSAGNPFRRWPLDHFVAVAGRLAADPRRRIVITSGPADRDAAAQVVAAARAGLRPDAADRVLACGEFSLLELRALLERAAVYIGGDSGPLHIAATTAVPIVGLYGPTLPERSAPWRPPHFPSIAVAAGELPCRPCHQRVCAPGDFRCLTRIAPERVVEAALECLQ